MSFGFRNKFSPSPERRRLNIKGKTLVWSGLSEKATKIRRSPRACSGQAWPVQNRESGIDLEGCSTRINTDGVLSGAKNLASCLMFRLRLNSVNPRKSVSGGGTPGLAVYQLVGSYKFAHAPGLGDATSWCVRAIAIKYLRNAAQAGLLS